MRLYPILAALALALPVGTALAETQPEAPSAVSPAAPQEATTEAGEATEEASPGWWQRFNDGANDTFGNVNGFLAKWIFYDLFHTEVDAVATGTEGDLDATFAALVAELEEGGELDPTESALTLKLPPGTLDEAGIEALRLRLRASLDYAEVRTRDIAITVPEGDDAVTAVTLNAYSSGIAFAVLWLVLGAIFFTLRMGFINIRGFKHALGITRGIYDNPDDEGEVSHFQALTSALSATVGLGNIAGVAIAISVGGPGATFWMILAGLMGMASKFTECTLGVKFRNEYEDGSVSGGVAGPSPQPASISATGRNAASLMPRAPLPVSPRVPLRPGQGRAPGR